MMFIFKNLFYKGVEVVFLLLTMSLVDAMIRTIDARTEQHALSWNQTQTIIYVCARLSSTEGSVHTVSESNTFCERECKSRKKGG